MQRLALDEAAKEIALAAVRTPSEGRRPFVFIAGAGLSHPSVPLASAIERHCIDEAERIGRTNPPLRPTNFGRYSHYFDLAYPHAVDRQQYLRSLIDKKPVSAANLRLAHLLMSEKVATIAVTPNFDPFLSTALTLFGRTDHRLCDHPGTVDRIDPEIADLQIVHVHGTYWYYDLCNLEGEIDERAGSSRESSFTMLGLLDRIFANRSPIVVGYSGWEGDVIMTALKRRLHPKRRLPFRMYWFCYNTESAQLLPDWLSEHPDLYVITPAEQSTRRGAEGKSAVERTERSNVSPIPNFSGGADGGHDNVLPAVRVLDELIRALDLEEPLITRDPLRYYAEQLRSTLSEDLLSQRHRDPYSFRSVISRLERAHEHAVAADRAVEELRGLVRRSRYLEAISCMESLELATLDEDQVLEIIRLLYLSSDGLSGDPNGSTRGYKRLEQVVRTVAIERLTAADQEIVALAHLKHAALLDDAKEYEQVVALADATIAFASSQHYAGPADIVSRAAILKVNATQELPDVSRHLEVYDAVLPHFQQSDAEADSENLAYILVQKQLSLMQLNRDQEAQAVYDEIISRFSETTDPYVQSQVVLSDWAEAMRYRDNAEHERALDGYDLAINRYTRPSGSEAERFGASVLVRYIALAILGKAETLKLLGKIEEALETYDSATAFLGESQVSDEPQDLIDQALAGKIILLAESRRFDEALPCVTRLASDCTNEDILSDLLSNLHTLATGVHPPHGIKQFENTVRKLISTHHR